MNINLGDIGQMTYEEIKEETKEILDWNLYFKRIGNEIILGANPNARKV